MNWIISCHGKRSLLIVVASSDVRANRNNYFTVFVCAKTGDKIAIPHVKLKHFPLVYFEFSKRIGRHPKVMYSDLASEITSSMFERYLLVKGVNHVNVPRGESSDSIITASSTSYAICCYFLFCKEITRTTACSSYSLY